MMSARLIPGTSDFEPAQKLFDLPRSIMKYLPICPYDVAPDGKFLMLQDPEAGSQAGTGGTFVRVVLNWLEEFLPEN